MAAESGAEAFADKAVAVYRECAKTGSVTKARVSFLNRDSKSGTAELNVISSWSQRDLERSENRNFHRSHIATYDATAKSFCDIREPSFPVEIQNLQLSSVSPSGKIQAIVRKVPGCKGKEDKQFLEIWSTSHLVKSIDVQICEEHGNIYEDSQFGCLAWSASEQFLLYVAEKKLPKAVSYFERQKPEVSADKPATQKGTQFDFKEDWGELLVSKSSPVLVIYDLSSDAIKVLDGVPDYLSAGQACWGPDDSTIVFAGWFHEPYRLGLIYCPIRKNALFSLSLDGKTLEQLSDIKYAVHSPRFNHTKDKLTYIALDVGGPHNQCGRVIQYDWNTKATSTIIDVVDIPERGGFPGIFMWGICSERCWTRDGTSVIVDTTWRSSQKIILVNCIDKSVTLLTTTPGCWALLDVNQDIVLASHSAPNSPPKLMMAVLPDVVPESGLSWIPVAHSTNNSLENEITWEVIQFKPSEESDFKDEYEAVFMKPAMTSDRKPPLIVFPHGGPHSSFMANFLLQTVYLCKLGFAVLCVNFRGSLGFGKTALYSLPGKVGTQDVQDVQRAATKVLESGEMDSSNVFVMGGSHGGFLTAHLISQYPDFYRAAAMRNPALNIPVMTEISDSPDWCYSEGGYQFSYDITPSAEMLAGMLKKSPVSYVSKVKTPTLIMLGAEDLRVPPSEGKNFYRLLKAQGTEARLLWYPGNSHPISKVDAESDAFVNIALWFYEHLQK